VGTALQEQGHQVRLIPAQFVKPYRKSNKNDFLSHPGSGKGRKREPEQKMKIRPKDFALRYLSGETFQKPTRGPE
jgi:hypothetical protein